MQHIYLVHVLKYGNFQQPFEHLKHHKPAIELIALKKMLRILKVRHNFTKNNSYMVILEFIPGILPHFLMLP